MIFLLYILPLVWKKSGSDFSVPDIFYIPFQLFYSLPICILFFAFGWGDLYRLGAPLSSGFQMDLATGSPIRRWEAVRVRSGYLFNWFLCEISFNWRLLLLSKLLPLYNSLLLGSNKCFSLLFGDQGCKNTVFLTQVLALYLLWFPSTHLHLFFFLKKVFAILNYPKLSVLSSFVVVVETFMGKVTWFFWNLQT